MLLLMALPPAAAAQDSEPRSAEGEKLMEAVFRYQIKTCSPNTGKKVFLLSDSGKDLSDEFMSRFKDSDPPVKKQSVMGTSEANNEFIDKGSGEPATLLVIDKIKWLGGGKAKVEGSCGFASLAGQGYKYELVLEDEKWVVKGVEPTWVARTAPPNNGMHPTANQRAFHRELR
jgi:hypothetical protein